MHEELIIAGAGGQGILFAGELIGLAAMAERKVTLFKSYGPTMRGGDATRTVIISSEEIGSMISEHPDFLIVMNKPSLKFTEIVKPRGVIIINKSLVDWDASREDVEVLEVRATELAQKLGDAKVANLIMVGAYLKKTNVVSLENVIEALKDKAIEKKWNKRLVELNEIALKRGWNEVK